MRGVILLAILLAACAPASPMLTPVAPPAAGPPPAAPAPDGSASIVESVVRAATTALPLALGVDPLEGEEAPPVGSNSAPPDESLERPGPVAGPTGTPRWLRPVREPPPPTIVGSGQAWPKRVGLQVGHWRNEEVPDELQQLRASGGGATGGGYTEVQVNLDLATRTAARLRERGVEVDILPATVPRDYRADAFVSIHADGDPSGNARGFKIARSPLSQIPAWDDRLVEWLYAEYGPATGLARDDDRISRRMLYYYAFNNRRYYHAVGTGTPSVIVETGYMTSAADRALLVGAPERAAEGIAAGILGFLQLK